MGEKNNGELRLGVLRLTVIYSYHDLSSLSTCSNYLNSIANNTRKKLNMPIYAYHGLTNFKFGYYPILTW